MKLFLASLLTLLPALAFADSGFQGIIQGVGDIVFALIPVAFGLAFLFFVWGLAKFILHADNEDKRAEGKQVMMWGIVALFVITAVWGIVGILRAEINVDTVGGFPIPSQR